MVREALSFLLVLVLESVTAQSFVVGSVQEFNSAVNQVQPGGTIVLRDGTWEDAVLEFYADGVEGDSITLRAQTPGEVVLTGSSRIEIAGSYLIVKDLDFNGGQSDGDAIISFRENSSNVANHSRVTNCRILNYNPSSDATEYKWVSLYGTYNRVDHCNFEGKNNEGALLVVWLSGSANHHRIDHNYFADIPELGRNGAETIRIGTSTNSLTESRTIVEYNLFESCDGEIEIISNKSGFNIYRYNTFRDNEGTLTLRHGNDCEVYGNFFFGENKDSGGVRIIGERHKVYNNYFEGLDGDGFRAALSITNGVPDSPLNRYFQVKNAEVVHNTFVGCKEPLAFGEGKSSELSLPPINCIIANNVVDQTTGSKAITLTDTPIDFEYTANYINGTVGISEVGIINENPQLTENGIWRLSESSPLINSGSDVFVYITNDIDGERRDDQPDIGSDEYSTAVPLKQSLQPEDVGFNWEVDDTTVVTGIEGTEIGLSVEKRSLRFHGIEEKRFPIRVALYSLNGQLLVDREINVDSALVGDFTNQILLLKVVDKEGIPLLQRKVFIEEN